MTGAEREALRAAIDRRRRELVAPPQHTGGSYNTGCRCYPCKAKEAAKRRAWRQAHLEHVMAQDREYKRRRRHEKDGA